MRGHKLNTGENPWDFESGFDGVFGVFSPYGSDKTVKSGFQLIAGSNKDLEDRVKKFPARFGLDGITVTGG